MFVADAVELSRAAAGLTTSMTGVLISGTVHYTPQAALLLQKEDWQLKAMSVTYGLDPAAVAPLAFDRSAERSVGKAWVSPCRSRWSPDHQKTKKKLIESNIK